MMQLLRRASAVLAFIYAVCFTITTPAFQNPPGRRPPPPLLSTVSPLTQAVMKRDLTRLQQLLGAGEDPNQRDDQGSAPWMYAIVWQENDALNLLLNKIMSIPPTDVAGRRKLAITAGQNNVMAARALLDRGVPVDSPAIDGATPLR